MPILSNDLTLLKSAVMSDAPESGGGMTETVIVDGQSNNIFDDISTLARTNGQLMARKFFAKVQTQNADRLYGPHVIISKLPKDQRLGVNLFNTADHYDVRTDAISRVENYKGEGAKYIGFLYGTQYKGSKTLNIFQNPAVQSPAAGEVLELVALDKAQYVRCVAVTETTQSFTDTNGIYNRKVVAIELSSALKADFLGVDISRYDSIAVPTLIYKTMVANAAQYFSARPLKNAAEIGDYSVTVDSIYSQLIPSSQSQVPLLDLSAGSNCNPLISSASGAISFVTSAAFSASVHLYLGRACYPKTLSIAYGGGVITDNAGNVQIGSTTIGTIDYAAGMVVFASTAPSIGGGKTVSFIPATAPIVLADTDSIEVTEISRSFVYVLNINPPPQPNALLVSYMAQGSWYELRDDGAGGLAGALAGVGSGSVNYATGSVSITLADLPDVGSEIVFAWGKKADFAAHNGNALALMMTKQLAHGAIDAANFTITWNDGVSRTILCNSAGVLSGDGTGSLIATMGEVSFSPALLPPKDTVFTFHYRYGDAVNAKTTQTLSSFNMTGETVELNVGEAIIAGSLVVEWAVGWGSTTPIMPTGSYANLPTPASGTAQQSDRDNGTGGFVHGRNAVVDYATGLVAFNWSVAVSLNFPVFSTPKIFPFASVGGGGGSVTAAAAFVGYVNRAADLSPPATFTVHYLSTGLATTVEVTETTVLSSITIKLVPNTNDALVQSSVSFSFAGKNYIDRLGQLYYDIDASTGAGIFGGTIDYSAASCALSSWAVGSSNAGTLWASLSTANFAPVDRVAFRTASAPIKPASFSIRAVPLTGGQITATANEAGVISTPEMIGQIDNNTGVVKIKFGRWITAAGNEAQPWFNPENIINGQIFHPKPVLASSIVYNAVSYTYLPLSPDVLGIDPVRLPIDGRVPIYHKGDILVILSDQTTVGTFTSSSTTDLGRIRLAKVVVKDLGGNLLVASKWTANLDTGVISWGDLSGVSQPLKIIDRIEDMAVLTDVQITGKLSLSMPVTHHFNALDSLVANAVVLGDKFARASVPFDQQTWTNVWSENLIGASTLAQYNATLYPLVLVNSGAVQERWALIFTTPTTFNVIGEHVGQVLTGVSIGADCSPMNPAANDPYFVLNHLGFGSGWSAGNVLRFNTYAAASPLWALLSVGQGAPTDPDYGFCVEFRGDVDVP